MPFPNGRSTILVEQPSYHLYMDYLKPMNFRQWASKEQRMALI